jgi:SpoVK/Ycf46/Vps4 family AAA+-type ATPase
MRKEQEQVILNLETGKAYRDNFRHIEDELRKLDLLIRRRIKTTRQQETKMREINLNPGLYVSHDEVDYLLQPGIPVDGKALPQELVKIRSEIEKLQNEISVSVSASLQAGVFLALPQLAHLFNLSSFELQVVIICLAPELRRKYDKIFVYLQDDITRKKPGIDMVLDLLCQTETGKWKARAIFSDNAPLLRFGILQIVEDPHNPSASSDLARFLKLDPRILNFLMGNNSMDSRLPDAAKLYQPSLSLDDVLIDQEIKTLVMNIIQGHPAVSEPGTKKLILHLHGPRGAGKRDLALGICRQLNCFLLYLDMELLLAKEQEGTLLRAAYREGVLMQAILYIDNIDILFSGEPRSKAFLKSLAPTAAEYGGITILASEKSWPFRGWFENIVFHSTALVVPTVEIRQKAWEKALENENMIVPDNNTWAPELARQFHLTPGQIRDAVEFARCHYLFNNSNSNGNEPGKMTLHHLYAASRDQSNQKLTELAVKISPKYGWPDIVLAEEKILQLNEICSQVKYRYRVFDQWDFQEKLSYGKGLSVLFTGAPGTGKTMAAQVMARELQLDLYKIDLSSVVSKYIGETEKNLARVFHEAETSNAILFFDEADALFGKRTEVSDAHDRYANIETSFLLQKMEEYEGVVILATNLRKNMDEAFTRRIRFIVEFPFPDEKSRLHIWKTHFPKQAPLDKGIDYEFLAKQFPVSGGSIRNIVLNAAFFAAQNGRTIGMTHILNSAKREYEKIGKLWDEKSFETCEQVQPGK